MATRAENAKGAAKTHRGVRPAAKHVSDCMTPSPHSIGAEQPLAVAHQMMRKHRVRHLPVLRAGKLVGLVSQRDLYLLETLCDLDPEKVTVEDAMSQDVYSVKPSASLARTAQVMADKRYGCAVVMEEGKVVGIFTTVDALRVLATLAPR
jgi:acetoin utilization protein AcuB